MIPHKFIPLLFSYFGKNDGQVINKISKYLDRGRANVLPYKLFPLNFWHFGKEIAKLSNIFQGTFIEI